jgi:anti-sigma factor RsiW
MSTVARQPRPSDGFRILDPKGCLTMEVLCFTEQLNPDQRAAVERHTRSCSVCAQQQTALARASERFRRRRPRQVLPSELRLLARQAALRTVISKRQRASTTARLPVTGRRRGAHEPWYRSRLFWTALLAGMGAALLVLLAVLLFI